ncbi:hypothetical protein [Sulfuracidifex metallicus]|uniref:hypothetical protein n=1 Tax=Sulfuracidifex metallicus TaxID=47303 RepID=UPI002274784D|nr:hypothetical protein [Sulfuracidifex metallicus]MCY0851040.1 hypothetical protein [Sulfuracidifex metallicus]
MTTVAGIRIVKPDMGSGGSIPIDIQDDGQKELSLGEMTLGILIILIFLGVIGYVVVKR